MKRIYQFILLVVVAIVSFNCQKELSGDHTIDPGAGMSNQSAPIISTLQGNVLDSNDAPAAGVKISVGSKTTLTNAHGYFRITNAPLDKNASLVTAEMPGYFKAYKTFSATSGVNQVVIYLRRKILTGTVDANAGGTVSPIAGAKFKIVLPSKGIITTTGTAYSGSVNVYALYIDPTSRDIATTVPGSFMADDKNNKRVLLSSFGMLAVELETPAGERLQIAPGSVATLTIPISPAIAGSAPATISLWYIDEQTGLWKEQGTAQKAGNNYIGEVKHFCYWNCDFSLPSVGFSAVFETEDGEPLKNVTVIIRPVAVGTDSARGAGGLAHGYTDSLGQVAGLIPSNTNLVLEVMDECFNVAYTKNIGSFSKITDLGTIVVPNTVSALVTLKGQLLSCTNSPVSYGFAIVYWNNFVSYLPIDGAGKFTMSVMNCSGATQSFQVLGVDAATQEQSMLLTIPASQHITDAGSIIACGASSAQFVDYKLDGVDYAISAALNDSLGAFTYLDSLRTGGYQTYVNGSHSTANHIRFDFASNGAGVYPLISLEAINFSSITLTNPFNITLTAYPANPGEFYEGNFSGSFTNSSTGSTVHTIDCKFRIRK